MRSRANMGYGQEIGLYGEIREDDWFTCQHCSQAVRLAPRQRPEDAGGMCKTCGHLICRNCLGKPCLPIEKWLDMQENPNRQFGKIHPGWKAHPVYRK